MIQVKDIKVIIMKIDLVNLDIEIIDKNKLIMKQSRLMFKAKAQSMQYIQNLKVNIQNFP